MNPPTRELLKQINAEKKASAEISEICGRRKNKKCFPQITQINAEKTSAEISEICGREKTRNVSRR